MTLGWTTVQASCPEGKGGDFKILKLVFGSFSSKNPSADSRWVFLVVKSTLDNPHGVVSDASAASERTGDAAGVGERCERSERDTCRGRAKRVEAG